MFIKQVKRIFYGFYSLYNPQTAVFDDQKYRKTQIMKVIDIRNRDIQRYNLALFLIYMYDYDLDFIRIVLSHISSIIRHGIYVHICRQQS